MPSCGLLNMDYLAVSQKHLEDKIFPEFEHYFPTKDYSTSKDRVGYPAHTVPSQGTTANIFTTAR